MNKILHFGISVRTLCMVAISAAVSVSCVKRDLYIRPDEGKVFLEFDWQKIASGEVSPDQMSVYLYGEKGNLAPMSSDGHSFSATLPAGKYKVLAINEKIDGVGFSNMTDFEKAYAYALPLAKKSGKAVDDAAQWIGQPGWLYCVSLDDLVIRTNDSIARVVVPKPLVQRILLNIKVTGEFEAVTNASAALTGVAPSARLATGACSDGYASVTELNPTRTETGFSANVLVFGVRSNSEDGSPAPNQVHMNLNYTNGGSQEWTQDISESDIQNPTEIEINIDVNIEVSPTSEGGFVGTVTRWEITSGGLDVDNRPGGLPLDRK